MNKKTILIVAGAAVLMLGGGVGLGYYLTSTGTLGASAEASTGGETATPAPEPESVGVIELDPFLTNIGDAGGKRHARLQVKLGVAPAERAAELSGDALATARLRDTILTLLTAKTFEDLTSAEGKERFRQEIVERASPLAAPGKVTEALFSDLVVQ
jgi:flagellar protein FliL